MPRVLAVDIGGTKLEVGAVDEQGDITTRRRGATQGDGDLWDRLARLVEEVVADDPEDGLIGCGVGCGGPMTAGGEQVSPLNIHQWRGFPLRQKLTDLLGLSVWIENDAKALAVGEAWKGRAQGERNFIALVVSTGVGGGIVLDGRLLDGTQGNAGHIGHVVVEPEGTAFPHHVRGVLEAEASGPAIAWRTGRPPDEADEAERERAGRLVGRAVGSVANLLDLRLAVVAGSVALGFGEPFFAAAQDELNRIAALDHSRGAIIVPAGLGADGPLIGAAAVGFRGLGYDVGVQ